MRSFTIQFFIFLLLQLSCFTTYQANYLMRWCYDGVNYTTNSIYGRNINTLLSSFSSNSNITDGFYNLSVGNPPDRVNGFALCRGDISSENCGNCINDSTVKILQICPNQMEAYGFYDFCMLRFTNQSIFGVNNQGKIPTFYMWSANNVSGSKLAQFNQALKSLMRNLTRTAAAGDSRKKFATGREDSGFDTIFGLVQCTPDLSSQDCENCLVGSIEEIPKRLAGKIGGRVMKPSCNLQFENYQFYENTTSIVGFAGGGSSSTGRTIVIVVVSVVGVLVLIIFVFLFLRIRKPKRKLEVVSYEDKDEIEDVNSLQFNFETIRAATSDFSDQNKLGQGGFGAVYKGTLPCGREIAVKRLSKGSGQGELEFKNEVLLVAKLQHRNLVRLLGFCFEGDERLLVYEFVANSSLHNFIFDPIERAKLDWVTRYKIIGGIARGLVYLHEDSRLRIIHRDLKASNILLDKEMKPKISDYGIARLFQVDQTQEDTSRIVGTFGYMAPEYVMRGHFSMKSDVFSFGVLILEIVSGRKQSGLLIGTQEEDLLTFAWRNWNEGTTLNVMDSTLVDGSRDEVIRCIHIGLQCVQENEGDRPIMTEVITVLSSSSITLPAPLRPAFFPHAQQLMTPTSRPKNSTQSRNEASITALVPR